MKPQFRPYQGTAYQHLLAHPEAALFLDLGLGKTLITLQALLTLMYDWFEIEKPLVIAPKSVALSVWDAEAAKWDGTKHLRISKIIGTAAQRRKAMIEPADLYVTNVDNVKWLCGEWGVHWPYDMLILDELSKFKNSDTQRFQDLKRMRPKCKRVVGLTATPMPNSERELWPQMYLLDMGERLGKSEEHFTNRYFDYDMYERKYTIRDGAAEEIAASIEDIAIRMSKADHLDLPPLLVQQRRVRLPADIQKQYDRFEAISVIELMKSGEVITAINGGALSTKLRQFASGNIFDENKVVHHIHNAKYEALEDLVDELHGQPVIIAYWFQHECAEIMRRFPDAEKFESKNTEDIVRRWNQKKIPKLVAQWQSMAYGLNLQEGGNYIIGYSPLWSSEFFDQFLGRLHRSGQTQKVVVTMLVVEGTIDEDMVRAVANKMDAQEAMLQYLTAKTEQYGNEFNRARAAV